DFSFFRAADGMRVVRVTVGRACVRTIEGLGVVLDSRAMMERGEVPARQFADMMMIGVAGLLLVIPGFVTDIFGFALLVPPIRGWLYNWMSRNMVVVTTYRPSQPGQAPKSIDLDEGDYR